MVTGADLKRFAEENGLTIPPYRDYDEWAISILNPRGGMCPCKQDRMCPCNESIEEIKNAPSDDRACCTCTFYCDERYINHWKENWIKQGIIKDDGTKQTQKKIRREIKNEEIKSIINTLESVRNKIRRNDVNSAVEIIMKETENSHCDACRAILDAETHRAVFLTKLYAIDANAYEIDAKRAIDRLDELIILYERVDESLDVDEIMPRDEERDSGKYRDDYHRCLSDVMKHQTMKQQAPASKDRFKIANLYCSGKAKTMTEAIELFERDQT